MKKAILPAIYLTLSMTFVTGIIYPLFITAVSQLIFPGRADGSLVKVDGSVVGSKLIGQHFTGDRYFWSRPSSTDYNALPSGASNYGPTSDSLKTLVEQRRADFIQLNGLPSNAIVPAEMLYASGSGLDPDISPEGAELQIERVARARRFGPRGREALAKLVRRSVRGPQFGLLGEPRVNVLLLNIALDTLHVTGRKTS